MTEIRMWHEWTDGKGAWQTDEASFEAWRAEMQPHREALLTVWACKLRLLLEQNPGEVPYDALHTLYADAETLRMLGDEDSWKAPFNRMRGAVQQHDLAGLRRLAASLEP